MKYLPKYHDWIALKWQSLSWASKFLVAYALVMIATLLFTYAWSLNDHRFIREVGIWVKPMKFMASTALFALTTVWVLKCANSSVGQTEVFSWIVALLVATSLFEVVYIGYQASQGAASHYNVGDPFHAFMFGVMAIAAVGLTMTFVLSTISGFMLGGNQAPAGQGIPIVGWHLYKDIRPAHFLGVHAQQLIPLWGLLAAKFMGSFSSAGLLLGSLLYFMLWVISISALVNSST